MEDYKIVALGEKLQKVEREIRAMNLQLKHMEYSLDIIGRVAYMYSIHNFSPDTIDTVNTLWDDKRADQERGNW